MKAEWCNSYLKESSGVGNCRKREATLGESGKADDFSVRSPCMRVTQWHTDLDTRISGLVAEKPQGKLTYDTLNFARARKVLRKMLMFGYHQGITNNGRINRK